jgi:hypothetical protein
MKHTIKWYLLRYGLRFAYFSEGAVRSFTLGFWNPPFGRLVKAAFLAESLNNQRGHPTKTGWRFHGWIAPGSVTWGDACWFLGGTKVGSRWWQWSDTLDTEVESLCVLGFCFERPRHSSKSAGFACPATETKPQGFGPSEWVDLLLACQNGRTTCMRALQIIERETVSMGWVREQHTAMLALCQAIERLPAGEQQTAISLQASGVAQEMQRVLNFVYAQDDNGHQGPGR